MTPLNGLFIGDGSLLIQCGEQWLTRGHSIGAVVSTNPEIHAWAKGHNCTVAHSFSDLPELKFDWLLSIANLTMIPKSILKLAKKGALNFHDGPLPRYAGLNAPVWAILNGETEHGITWHVIEEGADTGDIVEQRLFEISPNETALTLNTKCYEAALNSFGDLIVQIENKLPNRQPQNFDQRSYFSRDAYPDFNGVLDFEKPAIAVARLVRGLDHGPYWNPLCCAKITHNNSISIVQHAEPVNGDGAPGRVLETSQDHITVACGQGAVKLWGFQSLSGETHKNVIPLGQMITKPGQFDNVSLANEQTWRKRLSAAVPYEFPFAEPKAEPSKYQAHPISISTQQVFEFAAAFLKIKQPTLALNTPNKNPLLTGWVPVSQNEHVQTCATEMAADLFARDTSLSHQIPLMGISNGAGALTGTVLCFDIASGQLFVDQSRLSNAAIDVILARLQSFIATGNIIPAGERETVLTQWNDTAASNNPQPIHHLFEAQAQRKPNATALVFEDKSLSYEALNKRANQVASVLSELGVGPDVLVGLYVDRSLDMLVAALAILKAGGAYVPMDPTYPDDRISHFIHDSNASVLITQRALTERLPAHNAAVLEIDVDPRFESASAENLGTSVSAENLAYMIYTSGSTGRPKGVMVEHGNVANFFAGMDAHVLHDPAGVWMAVTSLSFDISVLELFYTLARGFKTVISGSENRAQLSNGPVIGTGRGMDFSLYYWGNDDGVGPEKYATLLKGAQFADANGFCAVWTPERHFHAFGGPYPNPSVTGAAVAAITNNIAVRAGSCVAPLHHPARIAEEWAVIDNLTNGRTGIGFASGWQPDDFLLRPENTPPLNKPALYESIKTVRALWAGESVEFPKKDGSMHSVVTQPRPVSKKLEVWVTTAGNPQTWIEAGELGANILTHLLGQSVEEVGEKIKLYHEALRKSGHDPADFNVTLMLHSFVADDRETAREIAREPMKDYLRSAAGLIKQYAWAFPAFKRPEGAKNAFDLELGSLEEEELEGILDFAFLRYFEDSGLFGTVDDCVQRVEALKRIGVDEVACLIDYGIAPEIVLEGLKPLAEVLRKSNIAADIAEDDFSIAAQIARHNVTHMQCTPSMARMIAMDDDARDTLGQLDQLLIGGEALPGALVDDLREATSAQVLNMYGPTETTIWSSVEPVMQSESTMNIGKPIANTSMYVLDDDMNPTAIGEAGELYIGGQGVTRGYWQRDTLTAERFVANPFGQGRLYRTGDLAAWRVDGRLDFFGRSDHQVKLRGYRIELGEIEAALEHHDSVEQAVVVAREDTPGDLRLVAYIKGQQFSETILKEHLSTVIPSFMVPSHFVSVDQFPLTPNQKIDRAGLPKPTSVVAMPQSMVGASDTLEQQIARVWSHFLGVENISSSASFFELGGHSLLAVQVHRELRTTLSLQKLSITDIFRFPKLKELAGRIRDLSEAKSASPQVATPANENSTTTRTDAMSKRRAMRAQRKAARS
ncbi:MupA/Atu3671 family FMN-dependent luciferase-like monooxygenase [Cochlodiniinecator piscidefendens]|uniref:MupA/Atu3671 family FMN-dependent luciferase-like monooxygenase n=1 Tax=Cochlodiniinecator piscidefendens TaxID=2715756 RepID=UPI00140756DA|nr:MupA/Atu3671 family FMN-dependent luciferase-like monooxygenase [Cochlodiniinecator piscidefendens]